jgi:hypothetical protein
MRILARKSDLSVDIDAEIDPCQDPVRSTTNLIADAYHLRSMSARLREEARALRTMSQSYRHSS